MMNTKQKRPANCWCKQAALCDMSWTSVIRSAITCCCDKSYRLHIPSIGFACFNTFISFIMLHFICYSNVIMCQLIDNNHDIFHGTRSYVGFNETNSTQAQHTQWLLCYCAWHFANNKNHRAPENFMRVFNLLFCVGAEIMQIYPKKERQIYFFPFVHCHGNVSVSESTTEQKPITATHNVYVAYLRVRKRFLPFWGPWNSFWSTIYSIRCFLSMYKCLLTAAATT